MDTQHAPQPSSMPSPKEGSSPSSSVLDDLPSSTPAPAPPPEKKRKKWPFILGACVLVLAALIGAAWWYVIGTPQYSMMQLKNAYETHDVEKAKQYVDVDAITDQLVNVIVDKVKEEVGNATEGEGGLLGGVELNGELLNTLMPQIKEQAKKEFQESFEDSVKGENDEETPFNFFGDEKTENAFAADGEDMLLTLHNPDEQYDVVFRLKQQDDRSWKIVAFDNADEILDKIMNDNK